MGDPTSKPKLPTVGAADGECVIIDGCVYEFNAEKNEWISKGVIPNPGAVSFQEDGLVTPDVFRKLSLIQELIEKGFDFSSFKLDSGNPDPYFYYFHSTDDLIKFVPEKIAEPKEVRGAGNILGISAGSSSTTVTITTDATTFVTNAFAGLELETKYGSFEIISNTVNQIVVKGDNSTGFNETSLRVGDRVKAVKTEKINHQLRIEIDKGRLYQKLVRNCCVGPKGAQGQQGDTGTSGEAASSEVFQLPSNVTDGSFSWNTIVNTPIDTPISLRIFREGDDETIIIEVIHPLDGTSPMILINDETISVEVSSAEVEFRTTSNRFLGSLVVTAGGDDIDTWRFKARQKGPKGKSGEAGKPFLEVIEQILDDTTIRGTEAIISMRKSALGDIIFFNNTLFTEIPVANLSAIDGDSISDILSDRFTAVQVTVREAKDIGFFQFVPSEFITPILDIPLWTPTSDCVQARRWSQYRFDWYNRSDPTYLFSITPTPKPPEQCCQEDFFFCPNVGDNPCEIQGEPKPPIPLPVPCDCECLNPIDGQLTGGGFVFDPIDLTKPEAAVGAGGGVGVIGETAELPPEEGGVPPGEEQEDIQIDEITDLFRASGTRGVESVLNGTEQTFLSDVMLCGNGEIEIRVEFDADVCGGEAEEREQCAFVDSNAVHISYALEDRNNVSLISNDGFVETESIPAIVSFSVATHENILEDVPPELEPGEVAHPAVEDCIPEIIENPEFCTAEFDIADMLLTVVFNDTKQDYCRGFRLVITARSDRFECRKERTFIVEQGPDSSIILSKDDDGIIIDPSSFIPLPPPPVIPPPTPLPPSFIAITAPICEDSEVAVVNLGSVAVTLLATDPQGFPLTYTIVTAPSEGVLTGTAPNLTYTSTGSVGIDTFIFTASNGHVDSSQCTVSVIVTAIPPSGTISSVVWSPATHEASSIAGSADVSFDTDNIIPGDGKICVTFPAGFDITGTATVTSVAIDGTFTISDNGQVLEIARNGDGTDTASGTLDLDISFYVNGGTGTFTIDVETKDNTDVTIDAAGTSNIEEFSLIITVPVLFIGGAHYPISQFSLVAAHAPFCLFDHWHGGPACSIDQFDTELTPGPGGPTLVDPAPLACGFGTKVPTGSGVVADLGTPDVGGIPEFLYSILTHDFATFTAAPCP